MIADQSIHSQLPAAALVSEKKQAFDLLDALTRSGGLPVVHSTVHVLMTTVHCFENSVMDTLVIDNVNPVDKVEASTAIMASLIHRYVLLPLSTV